MKLQAELSRYIDIIDQHKAEIIYHAEYLRQNKDYKSFNVRFCCDVIRACFGTAEMCKWYDKYNCHDSHITTLAIAGIKATLPELLDK